MMLSAKNLTKITTTTLIGLIGLGISQAKAEVNTFGCDADLNPNCSLQELFDGASIIIDGSLFSQWELLSLDITGQEPDFNLIEVIPLNNRPNYPKLRYEFNNQLIVIAPDLTELQFGFSLETLDNIASIDANSLELTDFNFEQAEGGCY